MPLRSFNGNTVTSRPRRLRIATIGGSMAAYHVNQTSDVYDLENRGILNMVNTRMGCPFDLVTFGVAGKTSAEVVSEQLPLLQPGQYDYVAVFVGGNDILNSVSFNTLWTNYQAIVNHVLQIGAIPLLFTNPPYANGALTAAQLRTQWQFRDKIMRWQSVYGTAYSFDLHAQYVNKTSTTSAWLTNYTYDNIHPSGRGNHEASIAVREWFRTVLGIADRDPSVRSILDNWSDSGSVYGYGVNLLGRGASFMQGSSGTTANLTANPCTFTTTNPVPGQSATDRIELVANSANVSGMACTVTVGTESTGESFLQLALTISAAGQQMYIRAPSVHANAVDGDWYEVEAVVSYANGGSVRPTEVCAMVNMDSVANSINKRASIGFAVAGTQPQGFSSDGVPVLRTPRKQYATALGHLAPVIRLTFQNTGTCTIRIRQLALRGYASQFGE